MTEYKSKVKYEAPIEINIEEDFPDSGSMAVSEIENMIFSAVLKVGITVDKEELIKALRYDRGQYEKGYADGKRDSAAAIEALQAQLPKRGEWIWKHRHHGGFKTAKGKCECGRDVYAQIDERYETEDPYCPFCGVMNDSIHLNYCPNCGAKMEVRDGK